MFNTLNPLFRVYLKLKNAADGNIDASGVEPAEITTSYRVIDQSSDGSLENDHATIVMEIVKYINSTFHIASVRPCPINLNVFQLSPLKTLAHYIKFVEGHDIRIGGTRDEICAILEPFYPLDKGTPSMPRYTEEQMTIVPSYVKKALAGDKVPKMDRAAMTGYFNTSDAAKSMPKVNEIRHPRVQLPAVAPKVAPKVTFGASGPPQLPPATVTQISDGMSFSEEKEE
jgi:hypothetical protein